MEQRRNKNLTLQMQDMVKKNQGYKAIELFLDLLGREPVNTVHLNVAMKGISDVEDGYTLIERAAREGINADSITYTTFIRILMKLDMIRDADKVLHDVQAKNGIVLDHTLRNSMAVTAADVARINTMSLQKLVDRDPPAAIIRYQELLRKGQAN